MLIVIPSKPNQKFWQTNFCFVLLKLTLRECSNSPVYKGENKIKASSILYNLYKKSSTKSRNWSREGLTTPTVWHQQKTDERTVYRTQWSLYSIKRFPNLSHSIPGETLINPNGKVQYSPNQESIVVQRSLAKMSISNRWFTDSVTTLSTHETPVHYHQSLSNQIIQREDPSMRWHTHKKRSNLERSTGGPYQGYKNRPVRNEPSSSNQFLKPLI